MESQHFRGTELENGFEKSKHFTTYLKLFCLAILKVQNVRIRKNLYPVVDQNRPIRKTQAQDRYSLPISAACLKKNYHWSPREKTKSFCIHNGGFFVCMKIDSKTARWKDDRALPIIRNIRNNFCPIWVV